MLKDLGFELFEGERCKQSLQSQPQQAQYWRQSRQC